MKRDYNISYWTSTLSSSDGTNSSAEFMLLYSRGKGIEGRNRINGMTIRPVTNDAKATGIVSIKGENKQFSSIYNLRGQRLAAPQKGINIINGKKVVVN